MLRKKTALYDSLTAALSLAFRARPSLHTTSGSIFDDVHPLPSRKKNTAIMPAILQHVVSYLGQIFLLFFLRPFQRRHLLAAPPLPGTGRLQAQRQPRDLAIFRAVLIPAIANVVSGACYMAFPGARWLSTVPFALSTLPSAVHIVYAGIYALEAGGAIDGGLCDALIESVERRCLVGNLFTGTPPAIPAWARHALPAVARALARVATGAGQEEEDPVEEDAVV